MLVHTLSFYGHEVIDQHHGITKDGLRYFGLLFLRSPHTGYTDTVGLRNSHDKSFPIGIAFGAKVFVCANLSSSRITSSGARTPPTQSAICPGSSESSSNPLPNSAKRRPVRSSTTRPRP